MTQIIKSSITDIPRNVKKGEKDKFGIEPFEKGLIRFINTTNTPITIALQGEWGSGKTSLMNSLKQNLSDIDGAKYHSVWLNTWEFALMKDAQSTLIDIILGLTYEVTKIANIDETKAQKLGKKVMNIGGSLLKFAGKTALNKVADGVGDVVEGAMTSKDKASTISEIRDELEIIIEGCITKDNKQGFIFFIDDLDRIDPPIAVELLELLKNIFTLKNCVFVLAIDYDVVIKGLEPKFGKLTASNEREFRSFFDKIIQVPFSMPVTSYKPDTFLQESLKSINYIDENQSNNNELISKFSEISSLTVGSNPRALKRLLNSISLIGCINSEKHQDEESCLNDEFELLINFALVSIQIAYPPVYKLLSMHSAFDKWNEAIAVKFNLKPLEKQSIEKLNALEEFDEEWEQVLFRLCENDYYLKKKALNIPRLLNILRKDISEKGEEVEDVIGAIISLSSVTSLEAFDKPVIEYHRGNFLKHLRSLLIPKLKEKMPEQSRFIKSMGKRVQTNAFINLSYKDSSEWIRLSSYPYEGGIRLVMFYDRWICKADHNSVIESLEAHGFKDDILKIEAGFNGYSDKFAGITQSNFFDHTPKRQGCYALEIYSYLILPNLDDFYKQETLDLLSNAIAEKYKTIHAMSELDLRYWEKNK